MFRTVVPMRRNSFVVDPSADDEISNFAICFRFTYLFSNKLTMIIIIMCREEHSHTRRLNTVDDVH